MINKVYTYASFTDDAAVQMNRYLLRTLCTDIFNHVLKYLADDNGVNLPSGNEFSLKVCTALFKPALHTYELHIYTKLICDVLLSHHFWTLVPTVAIGKYFLHSSGKIKHY